MPDEASHPRLFFGPEDLPRLREKIGHPSARRDWESVKKLADEGLAGPPIAEGYPARVLADAAQNAARCAFVHAMTGAEEYAERALGIVHALLGQAEEWKDRMIPTQRLPFHLRTAAVCDGLARAYDLLADKMAPDFRSRFVRTCAEHGVGVYISDCRNPNNPHLCRGRTMNWLAVLSSGAGLLALAMDGDGVDMSKEIEIARAHMLRFVEWYDDAGCATEHGGYWRYGMGHCVEFFAALRRNGWPEIFRQRHRKLERSPYPNLTFCLGALNVANFGDDRRAPLAARDAAVCLAATYQDRHLQWWAEQMPPGGDFAIVHLDTDLPAEPPDGLPTCIAWHGSGIAVLRENMGDPKGRFLALKGGKTRGRDTYDDPHCHMDLNAVSAEALGEPLLLNPGYGHNWANPSHGTGDPDHPYNGPAAHNTMLVNGVGPLYEHSPLAELQDLSPSKEIDYVVSRVVRGYPLPLERFDRHAYMVEKRFWVLVDDVELAEDAVLTWNFHAGEAADVVAGTPSSIAHGQARMSLFAAGADGLMASAAEETLPNPHDKTTVRRPRIQYDLAAKAGETVAVWMLWPDEATAPAPDATCELADGGVRIGVGGKSWFLPVVRRRKDAAFGMAYAPLEGKFSG